jgi:BirA family transcriptional regulator, biotin operon repressor / biotin---[acetyl-CoA-carboxylase] ligase
VESLRTSFRGCRFGNCIVYHPVMPSTMDAAIDEIEKGAPSGTVVICERQTLGRGRLGREWISPEGGLYLSIIVYPRDNLVNYLTIITSLAVLDAVRETCGAEAKVKWPNDIVLGGKKLSGIIAQSGNAGDGRIYAVIGVGINANTDFTHTPSLSGIATSLLESTGKGVSLEHLAASFLRAFEIRYAELETYGPHLKEWQDSLETLGKSVSVTCGSEVYQGVAESVSQNGGLVIRLNDGKLKEIPAGDVTLRA